MLSSRVYVEDYGGKYTYERNERAKGASKPTKLPCSYDRGWCPLCCGAICGVSPPSRFLSFAAPLLVKSSLTILSLESRDYSQREACDCTIVLISGCRPFRLARKISSPNSTECLSATRILHDKPQEFAMAACSSLYLVVPPVGPDKMGRSEARRCR